MNLTRLSFVPPALLLAALLIGGCGGSSSAPTCGPVTASRDDPPFRFTTTVDSCRFSPGRAVTISGELVNIGSASASMPVGAPVASAVVARSGIQTWNSFIGMGGGDGFGTITLAPGQSYPVSFTWRQVDSLGKAVGSGTYVAVVHFSGPPPADTLPVGPTDTPPVMFMIGP